MSRFSFLILFAALALFSCEKANERGGGNYDDCSQCNYIIGKTWRWKDVSTPSSACQYVETFRFVEGQTPGEGQVYSVFSGLNEVKQPTLTPENIVADWTLKGCVLTIFNTRGDAMPNLSDCPFGVYSIMGITPKVGQTDIWPVTPLDCNTFSLQPVKLELVE